MSFPPTCGLFTLYCHCQLIAAPDVLPYSYGFLVLIFVRNTTLVHKCRCSLYDATIFIILWNNCSFSSDSYFVSQLTENRWLSASVFYIHSMSCGKDFFNIVVLSLCNRFSCIFPWFVVSGLGFLNYLL